MASRGLCINGTICLSKFNLSTEQITSPVCLVDIQNIYVQQVPSSVLSWSFGNLKIEFVLVRRFESFFSMP